MPIFIDFYPFLLIFVHFGPNVIIQDWLQTPVITLSQKKIIEQNTDTPSLDQKDTLVEISREEALKQNPKWQLGALKDFVGEANVESYIGAINSAVHDSEENIREKTIERREKGKWQSETMERDMLFFHSARYISQNCADHQENTTHPRQRSD